MNIEFAPQQRNSSEAEAPRRKINMFFVRHGEQVDYKDPNSSLSERGRQQVKDDFAVPFISWLEDAGIENMVQVLASPRTRTLESGLIIKGQIEEAMEQGRISNTTLLGFHERPDLLQTQPIGKLISMGYDDPYSKWQELSEEFLALNGISSPFEIALITEKTISSLRDLSMILGPGPQINYVLVTHETTVGALAGRHFNLKGDSRKIEHAESIAVFLGEDVFYSFRGRLTGDIK